MINYVEAQIQGLAIHFVGSNLEENQRILLSDELVSLEEEIEQKLLTKYFFDNFKEPEFFNFADVDSNPMMQYVSSIFENPNENLLTYSQSISKFLYEHSQHPNIVSGDIMVAYAQNILLEDELLDAICIFKSENKETFLTLASDNKSFTLGNSFGINTGKLDKACIIFNTEKSEGYKICAVDKTNRQKNSQFWIEDFLNIIRRPDDYYHTKNLIQATQNFIKERVRPLQETDKTTESEILKRSHNFLTTNEEIVQEDYIEEIFQDQVLVSEFNEYKEDFQEANRVHLSDSFSSNEAALKKQAKVFKSVLKLDKNFSIYIHGSKSNIDKGIDTDGRKYYKFFYDAEN